MTGRVAVDQSKRARNFKLCVRCGYMSCPFIDKKKSPKHMESLSRSSDPSVGQNYANRLEGFVQSCRSFLEIDVFMDMLGDDLDRDPLWEQWSPILTREEQVHVRMVQASRVCARRSISAAFELLGEFVNPAQQGYTTGERLVKKLGDLCVGKE